MLSLMSSSRAAGISKIRSQHYGSIRIVPSSGSAQHRNSVALSPPGSASHPVPRLNLNLNLNLRPQANDASASFAGGDTRAGPEGVFSDDGIRPAAQVASSSRSNTNPAAAAALMSMKEQVNKSGAADSTEQPAGLKHVDAPPSGPAGAEEPPAVPGSAVAAEPAPGMLDSVREQTVHCHSESTRPQSKADGGEQFTPRGGRRNRPEQSGATAAALKKHTNTHSYRILLVGTCVLLSRLRSRRGVITQRDLGCSRPCRPRVFFFHGRRLPAESEDARQTPQSGGASMRGGILFLLPQIRITPTYPSYALCCVRRTTALWPWIWSRPISRRAGQCTTSS